MYGLIGPHPLKIVNQNIKTYLLEQTIMRTELLSFCIMNYKRCSVDINSVLTEEKQLYIVI